MQINSLPPHAGQTPYASNGATSTTGASAAGSTNSSTLTNPLADPNLFITLLTAQLQAQDPLNPMSPQDMVNQLTQVSSLQQLINISATLTKMSNGAPPATPAQANPSGSTNPTGTTN